MHHDGITSTPMGKSELKANNPFRRKSFFYLPRQKSNVLWLQKMGPVDMPADEFLARRSSQEPRLRIVPKAIIRRPVPASFKSTSYFDMIGIQPSSSI